MAQFDSGVINNDKNLIGSFNRIEIPYIKVTFGNLDSGYTFGVYQKEESGKDASGLFYKEAKITYPNYIKELNITKINGQVNEYTLSLAYPIRPGDDPNFFEKIFSSVSKSRKIYFSYGDMNKPTYIYNTEEAIITDVKTSFDLKGAVIRYTVSAVSSATLGFSGSYSFPGGFYKPSDLIKKYLRTNAYGLQEIFYGMSDPQTVEYLGLIPGDDKAVTIEAKTNISIIDYIKYLVSCMIPAGSPLNSNKQLTFYVLTIHDEVTGETSINSKTETLSGPYFKIVPVSKLSEHSDAYELTIGYPSANLITSFNIDNNENYSIYYDWQTKLNSVDYIKRLNDEGGWDYEYAPNISSRNENYKTRVSDAVWWTKITEYPISGSITVKGLLRPAILMQYVHINVIFHGRKHISSGTYIITAQRDSINSSGYRTTLSITRVKGESEEDYND